jgi:uncharacterized protein
MLGWILEGNNLEPLEMALNSVNESKGFEAVESDYSHIYQIPLELLSYTLCINSLNSTMIILKKDLLDDFMSKESRSETLINKFIARQFSKNIENLYEKYIQDKKVFTEKRNITISICPSYECNMKCPYCFQQHDKTLNKNVICNEKLELIFKKILKIKEENPSRNVVISLFGGEPFQEKHSDVLNKIFHFARNNSIVITATSNGYDLHKFWNLLIPFRGYVGHIGVTLDGVPKLHNQRRLTKDGVKSFDVITKNIDILIKAGIHVTVSTNLDQRNIEGFIDYLDHLKSLGWHNHPKITIEVGRVDDRCFDLKYKSYLSEGELLYDLIKINEIYKFPQNIKLAFLKSTFDLAESFGVSFNQKEAGRMKNHYCWATSAVDDLTYIDSNLDTYRCNLQCWKIKIQNWKYSTDRI